jgi:hypothetical protein
LSAVAVPQVGAGSGVDEDAAADLPDRLLPGVVDVHHEPTRILQYLPTPVIDTPVVEYIRHASTTGAAGMTAAGAMKPAVTLVTDKVEARAPRSR